MVRDPPQMFAFKAALVLPPYMDSWPSQPSVSKGKELHSSLGASWSPGYIPGPRGHAEEDLDV